MSRRRVQHLIKRDGNYELRFPVPTDLQAIFQRKEFRWSARTKAADLAANRALASTLAFRKMCDRVRGMANPTISEAQEIARDLYRKLIAEFSGHARSLPEEFEYENGFQETMADEWIADLTAQIQSRTYSQEIRLQAEARCSQFGFSMPEENTTAFQALCEAVIRAEIEFARFAIYRRTNALDNYVASDSLFQSGKGLQSSADLEPAHYESPGATLGGISLTEALDRYYDAMTTVPNAGLSQWRPKTAKEKKRSFEIAIGKWGKDFPVGTLSSKQIRDVRDFILLMKPHAEIHRSSLNKAIASKTDKRLDWKTANKYFGDVKTFARWLNSEGYTENWVGQAITIPKPKALPKNTSQRWSNDQINTIFSSPIYAGFRHLRARHEPGKLKLRDDFFWLFLIAYYTGARIGEIVQIRAKDISFDTNAPFIEISNDGQLKNLNSARKIPLHSDLLAFGFQGFAVDAGKKPNSRLFDSFFSKSLGNPGDKASKRANRYLERIDVKQEGEGMKFHTFRHTFIDLSRDAKIPEAQIKQLVGHQDNSTTAKYGSGASLTTLSEYIHSIDFGLSPDVRKLLDQK